MELEPDKGLITARSYLICVRWKPRVQSFEKRNGALGSYLRLSSDGVGALCISSTCHFGVKCTREDKEKRGR